MGPWIRVCISKLIGDEEAAHIDIVSNDVQYRPDGKWQIKYRHPSRRVKSLRHPLDV
jgi:2-hydroxy-3-keto-5-methylthiopentenyl-1-phosphate phosphatase